MPEHQPYVPATQSPAELTPRALLLGVLLGLIFSASSVYLALKIGLTVSSSIPIAVLSITIFRALGRTSILENNIVKTTPAATESLADPVVCTMLFSRIEVRPRARKIVIESTAIGMEELTVRPILSAK